jgi:hypothetical protein
MDREEGIRRYEDDDVRDVRVRKADDDVEGHIATEGEGVRFNEDDEEGEGIRFNEEGEGIR